MCSKLSCCRSYPSEPNILVSPEEENRCYQPTYASSPTSCPAPDKGPTWKENGRSPTTPEEEEVNNQDQEDEEEPIYAVVKKKPSGNEAAVDQGPTLSNSNNNNPVPTAAAVTAAGAARSEFLVSFLIDCRGGVMKGCRGSGIRLIVPPGAVDQPTRITCKFLKPKHLLSVLPLMQTDQVASGLVEFTPENVSFRHPILIEVPHFLQETTEGDLAQSKDLVAIRSDDGLTWKEHNSVYVGKGN